jgi:hypothetical protein
MATTQWNLRQPDKLDYLRPNGFYFLIQNFPQVTYFCQSATIPSINIGVATFPTPFVDIPKPGEKIDFGELTIKFLIQENLSNYIELYNWLIALGFPESRQQFQKKFGGASTISPEGDGASSLRRTDAAEYSDATLLALDSNYNPVAEFSFKDCFPVSLTGIEFDVSSGDTQYFTAQATFRYQMFTVESLA